MSNVLITGGEGYIGSNLIDFLAKNKCVEKCTSVDLKLDRRVLDIDNVWKYDAVVHLAAMAGIAECRDNPEDAVINNVISTFYLMEQCHKYEVPMVFASSGAAPTPYESLYGMTKWMGEVQAKRLNYQKAKIHVLRFSNVYGGKYWESKPSVIPLFLNAIKRGEALIVNGDGSQRRDFIHVFDICDIICKIIISEENNVVNMPVPVCSGVQTSVLELAKIIGGEEGYKFNLESDVVGVKEVSVDPSLAYTVYNFKAKINIREGIYM